MADPKKAKPIAPDHEVEEVKKKEIASILNHMVRVFTLPEANVATNIYSKSSFIKLEFDPAKYTYKVAKDFLDDPDRWMDFEDRMDSIWEMIQDTKPKAYKYVWNVENVEKDHIIEVQHIIAILQYAGNLKEAGWAALPVGTLTLLAYYLNDQRNLWSVPKAFNQSKAYIPLAYWYGKTRPDYIKEPPISKDKEWQDLQANTAREYLCDYRTEHGYTPYTKLLNLAAEMAGLPYNTLSWLTIRAGEELWKLLTSWSTQLRGVDDAILQRMKDVYNLRIEEKDIPAPVLTAVEKAIRKRLLDRAKQGLAIFSKDVDETIRMMNKDATFEWPLDNDNKDWKKVWTTFDEHMKLEPTDTIVQITPGPNGKNQVVLRTDLKTEADKKKFLFDNGKQQVGIQKKK